MVILMKTLCIDASAFKLREVALNYEFSTKKIISKFGFSRFNIGVRKKFTTVHYQEQTEIIMIPELV
jgi:hypothetical protein